MKLNTLVLCGSIFLTGSALAGSIEVNCSSPDQQIYVSRDEVKIKGKSYLHEGTNDVISLEMPGETVKLNLLTPASKPTSLKLNLLVQEELANKADTTGCRDILDTWTQVQYGLVKGPQGVPAKGLLMCHVHTVTTTGGRCH
jgi:hypothetical protein